MKDFLHGGRTYGDTIQLDFSANINPLGMPACARDAAVQGVMGSTEYPDPACTVLRRKLSRKWKVPMEFILPGNGAAELILHAVQAWPTDLFLIPVPSFYEYERAAGSVGGEIRWFRLKQEEGFLFSEACRDEILNAARQARAEGKSVTVLLGNPNNPTGACIPESILASLTASLEELGVRYLIDESFLPFVEGGEDRSLIPTVIHSRFGGVVRSFTKIYGMPGLRLGALVLGGDQWRNAVADRMQPWPVSMPALRAGEAALEATDFVSDTAALICLEREYLKQELSHGLAWEIHANEAPFILFRAPSDTAQLLEQQHIRIRACANFRGLDESWFRIGIRTHTENEKLVEQWRSLQ